MTASLEFDLSIEGGIVKPTIGDIKLKINNAELKQIFKQVNRFTAARVKAEKALGYLQSESSKYMNAASQMRVLLDRVYAVIKSSSSPDYDYLADVLEQIASPFEYIADTGKVQLRAPEYTNIKLPQYRLLPQIGWKGTIGILIAPVGIAITAALILAAFGILNPIVSAIAAAFAAINIGSIIAAIGIGIISLIIISGVAYNYHNDPHAKLYQDLKQLTADFGQALALPPSEVKIASVKSARKEKEKEATVPSSQLSPKEEKIVLRF